MTDFFQIDVSHPDLLAVARLEIDGMEEIKAKQTLVAEDGEVLAVQDVVVQRVKRRAADDRPIVFRGFNFAGRCVSAKALGIKSAIIRSDVAKYEVPLKAATDEGWIDADSVEMAPGAVVRFCAHVPHHSDDEVSVDQFKAEFGAFTFRLETDDGQTFKHAFTEADVNEIVAVVTAPFASIEARVSLKKKTREDEKNTRKGVSASKA
jgi:hypothetical protein